MPYKIEKSEKDWMEQLGSKRYRILREKGTEYPHSGEYNNHFEKGTYLCGGCQTPLFESESKFDGHCGWPSFDASVEKNVAYILDKSHGMVRTEIVCSNCGGHLGHVFNDGPTATQQRYCVNSLSVDFTKEKS
jgi:peptide-methionine (R)-S-oxide reductase